MKKETISSRQKIFIGAIFISGILGLIGMITRDFQYSQIATLVFFVGTWINEILSGGTGIKKLARKLGIQNH
jgi:hypothetical protein